MFTRRAICTLAAVLAGGGVRAQTGATVVTLVAAEDRVSDKVAGVERELANAGVPILAVPGHGPVQNVSSLLQRSRPEVAVLPADVLGYLRQRRLLPGAARSLRYVAPLYGAPVQILAYRNFASVAQLSGQRVGCGLPDSVSYVAAAQVFALLGVQAQLLAIGQSEALQSLRRRELAAMVYVGEAPAPVFFDVNREQDGVHFLPLVLASTLSERYPATRLSIQDYPLLIGEGEAGSGVPVPTIAEPMLLAVYNWPPGTPAYDSLSRFAAAASRFAPASEVPDWVKFVPGLAPRSVAGTPATQPPPVASPPANEPSPLTAQQRDALFKDYEKSRQQQR